MSKGDDISDNKNTKANKMAKYAEFIMFSLAFFAVVTLTAVFANKMEAVAFMAESFVLAFVFTSMAGKEYLYKMPAVIAIAIIIGAAIAQKLTLPVLTAAVLGVIACIIFLMIILKIYLYKPK